MSNLTIKDSNGTTREVKTASGSGSASDPFVTTTAIAGGSLQCGHIAVLTNGEGVAATDVGANGIGGSNQVVQLPDVPCRKAVIAFPAAAIVNDGLSYYGSSPGNGCSNDTGRRLYYGDETGQFWALEAGQAEELEVSNLNQIFLRDLGFSWEDFNADGFISSYVLVAFWRVIR